MTAARRSALCANHRLSGPAFYSGVARFGDETATPPHDAPEDSSYSGGQNRLKSCLASGSGLDDPADPEKELIWRLLAPFTRDDSTVNGNDVAYAYDDNGSQAQVQGGRGYGVRFGSA